MNLLFQSLKKIGPLFIAIRAIQFNLLSIMLSQVWNQAFGSLGVIAHLAVIPLLKHKYFNSALFLSTLIATASSALLFGPLTSIPYLTAFLFYETIAQYFRYQHNKTWDCILNKTNESNLETILNSIYGRLLKRAPELFLPEIYTIINQSSQKNIEQLLQIPALQLLSLKHDHAVLKKAVIEQNANAVQVLLSQSYYANILKTEFSYPQSHFLFDYLAQTTPEIANTISMALLKANIGPSIILRGYISKEQKSEDFAQAVLLYKKLGTGPQALPNEIVESIASITQPCVTLSFKQHQKAISTAEEIMANRYIKSRSIHPIN